MAQLPFLKIKRYLTGMDWVIHTLDHVSKKQTGVGNISQIVLELTGLPAYDELKNFLEEFIKHHPVTSGWSVRGFNLAPFWKIYRGAATPPRLKTHELSDTSDAGIILKLEEELNLPFNTEREHLVFHLLHAKDRYFVAMTFDHRLLDARGAEAFLDIFQQEQIGGNKTDSISLSEPSHLCDWRKKFIAGKNVNQAFRSMTQNTPPTCPLPDSSKEKKFKFKHTSLSKAETDQIVERVYDQTGYEMVMPYALAVSVHILHKYFTKKSTHTGDYVIPVSIDTRAPEKIHQEVFFNHISFFLFHIPQAVSGSFSDILTLIQKQMYEQVKSRLPENLKEASHLMRILPLAAMGFLMHQPLNGQIASFCFSYIGESAYKSSEFVHERILNIFHMPRAPVPPGLGIYFNQFQGKLNAVLSYVDGVLDRNEASVVMNEVRSHLGI